jgi:hypothetical protein
VDHDANGSAGLTKVCLPLAPDAWHGYENEWMWAEPVAVGIYALRNVPFYAKGLSHEDIVRTEERDGVQVVVEVVEHRGHSTYRIVARDGREAPQAKAVLNHLAGLGCGLEPATRTLVAIDVPPHVDVHDVYGVLAQAEGQGTIDFEEGHCGHGERGSGPTGRLT